MPRISLPTSLSPYQQHLERWRRGCGNSICGRASRKCFGKGRIPCDVLLIGESPGESENTSGLPFVGPAGQLLDKIIGKAISGILLKVAEIGENPINGSPRLAFTNLTLCIPREEDSNAKATEPSEEEVGNCKPRLEEFISLAKPRLIVCVGKLAWDHLQQGLRDSVKVPSFCPTCRAMGKLTPNGWKCFSGHLHEQMEHGIFPIITTITHPAAVLRAPVAQQSLMVRRMIVTLRNAVEELT